MSVSAYALAPCIAKASATTALFNTIGDNINVTFNYDHDKLVQGLGLGSLHRQGINNHGIV